MTRALIAAIFLLLPVACRTFAADVRESVDSFGPFGTLHIYEPAGLPKHVTLFISGDGGWNLGVVEMARSLTDLDSMAVGIDITHYVKRLEASGEKCIYAAAHFEALSQYLQRKHRFPRYTLPVLAGYSSGATMVYATLAQSPPNTFAGGIGLGFCPDLKTARPFCEGSGGLANRHDPKLGFIYQPVPAMASKFYVLQGDIDRVCSTPDTKAFLSDIRDAELIELAKVGHGFSVEKNWMPQFVEAFRKMTGLQQAQAASAHVPGELGDLPLVVLPAGGRGGTLAVIVSGDGGWTSIDKQIAETLNKDGIAVVGLNSLQYFWKKKDPDIAGRDLARILDHYGKAWSAEKFILVGYSSGADTLPFMAGRLPEALKSRVSIVALLGPGKETNFEFHVSQWLFDIAGAYKVVPEVQKLKGVNVLCIYGEDESDSACGSLDRNDFTSLRVKGGHHFGGRYEELAKTILSHSR